MIPTEVCFIQVWISPSHTRHFMVSSLKDSRLTSTPPCPTPALASNIYNLFISNTFPQVPFPFNHVPLSLTSQLTTHARYISLQYMVFECHNNIRNQPGSTTIPLPSPFCDITTTETHQHFGKILIDIFFIFSKQDGTTINETCKFTFYTHKQFFPFYYQPKNSEF